MLHEIASTPTPAQDYFFLLLGAAFFATGFFAAAAFFTTGFFAAVFFAATFLVAISLLNNT
jgi:hypothetical protein